VPGGYKYENPALQVVEVSNLKHKNMVDPRMTALARASSNHKQQIRSLVREGTAHQRKPATVWQ
jgi:hypothetical protein